MFRKGPGSDHHNPLIMVISRLVWDRPQFIYGAPWEHKRVSAEKKRVENTESRANTEYLSHGSIHGSRSRAHGPPQIWQSAALINADNSLAGVSKTDILCG